MLDSWKVNYQIETTFVHMVSFKDEDHNFKVHMEACQGKMLKESSIIQL